MSKLRNEKNGNRSFFSLKAKWSIGTGIGVLVIFAVFSVMLFQSFSSLLMNQEKQYAEDSLRTAIGKLADNEGELTKQDVVKSLSLKITPSDNQNLYTNSVYTSLTRENIGISVYNYQAILYSPQGTFLSNSVLAAIRRVVWLKTRMDGQSMF